ncbi:MAG: tRNA (adenosine(37)-N6)-dimethylallyltransferase MiaA [Alistipes onderdonkii]
MTTSTKRLVVIVGPTGSGKTDLSIRIALHYGAPILSTDSRQMYRGLPIGTAQPTADQLQAVEHHFIASHDLADNLSCGEYETQALACLERLFAGMTVVAVGGSGFMSRRCAKAWTTCRRPMKTCAELAARLRTEGLEALAGQLRTLDPDYYAVVDRSNPARVVRALEVCLQTGLPYSRLRTGRRRKRDFDIVKVGIDMPREELYGRIDHRVGQMLADGLEAEARAVYPYRGLNALQTVGYREFFDYFDGRISYDQAVELIKRNSRRYAKRQLTWFRRDAEIRWFGPDQTGAIINYIDFGES